MRLFFIMICFPLIMWSTGCNKETMTLTLPDGSISFDHIANGDTIEMPLSIFQDSIIVVGIKAALSGAISSREHVISFAIDTTKITEYRSRYGDARLLPTSSYLFYKADVRLAAGSTLSDSAELNITQQTKLTEYTTYVLPVVIQSVDGQPEGPASSRVLYFVFKTGRPLFISKSDWTIAAYSSYFSTFVPQNVLDNDNGYTYWASDLVGQMPQWVTIDFNKEITFSELTYYLPTDLLYPTFGGYPTSIRIETSVDGTNWDNKGVYEGNIRDDMQTLPLGLTDARYLRFTVLTSVKYVAMYETILISGISLM